MKKLLGLGCCLYASITFADMKSQCLNLVTTIHNYTSSACELLQKNIYNAKMLSEDDYTIILPKESRTIKLQEFESIFKSYSELSLSYACGSGQVTMTMRKEPCFKGGAITADTVAISSMEASATTSVGSAWHNRPGTVTWILSEKL